MATYNIHKGVGQSVEFKGLKSQYLFIFAGGLIGVIVLVFIGYVIGINSFICIGFGICAALTLVFITFRLNSKYGEYGLMKLSAQKARPRYLSNRKPFMKTLKQKKA